MDGSDYIALGSSVIALSAFILAIWQGLNGRKHNILSVKPCFHIDKSHLDGLHYTLESQGLGPGIIEKFSIIVNGKVYSDITEDPYPEIFDSLGIKGFNYIFHVPSKNSSHSPEANRKLLSIDFIEPSLAEPAKNKIEEAIQFEIVYKSIYENELFYCKNA
tara:strand:+ start:24892 stop:25374 length:483 start_codon:yes stop_codon:yes gene_type:complete